MKMTKQQQHEYKLYRATCRKNNITPVRAGLLAKTIYEDVLNTMLLEGKLPEVALAAFLPSTVSAPVGR